MPYERLDLNFVGDIDGKRRRGGTQFMGNALCRIGLDVRNDDAGARLDIGASDPLTKSATCTGNDRYLSS